MIKAVNGGGGRGIRIVEHESDLENEFKNAGLEAKACFGDGSLYMEKMITEARHIEIQILADGFGNVIHLYERDCSVQRRNQKVLEEAPCTKISQEIRDEMGKCAVNIAKTVGYENAGTVEFLLTPDNNFYFIEMNTRVQVEHPITEMITGVDIVKEQLKIASGKQLSYKQKDIRIKGHAIECRINAEDPKKNFMPSCDEITMLHLPGGNGIRIDSGIYTGYSISPFYDSMLLKLIAYAENRNEAIKKMECALSEMIIEGPETNADFQLDIISHKDYLKGDINTNFIKDKMVR